MNLCQAPSQTASLFRRFAAIVYDSFLIVALMWLASIPVVVLNQGEAISGNLYYRLYLLAVWFGFYAFFWRRAGQTLGMRAWKIRVTHLNGQRISWRQAALRFATAAFGLANLSMLFTPNRRAWHEHLSSTQTLQDTSRANKSSTTSQNRA